MRRATWVVLLCSACGGTAGPATTHGPRPDAAEPLSWPMRAIASRWETVETSFRPARGELESIDVAWELGTCSAEAAIAYRRAELRIRTDVAGLCVGQVTARVSGAAQVFPIRLDFQEIPTFAADSTTRHACRDAPGWVRFADGRHACPVSIPGEERARFVTRAAVLEVLGETLAARLDDAHVLTCSLGGPPFRCVSRDSSAVAGSELVLDAPGPGAWFASSTTPGRLLHLARDGADVTLRSAGWDGATLGWGEVVRLATDPAARVVPWGDDWLAIAYEDGRFDVLDHRTGTLLRRDLPGRIGRVGQHLLRDGTLVARPDDLDGATSLPVVRELAFTGPEGDACTAAARLEDGQTIGIIDVCADRPKLLALTGPLRDLRRVTGSGLERRDDDVVRSYRLVRP